MKEIKAIIQAFKLGEVIDAIQALDDISGITSFDVEGFGTDRGPSGLEVKAKGSVNYVRKKMILVVVQDEQVDTVVRTLELHAHTGNPGDGIVFVSPIESAVRLRTGARGEAAL
jgi:nitrogen regulatory protein P-II 1